MGEEERPQGVRVGGMRARGVKGGDGREERPVPPIMAIGTASSWGISGVLFRGGGEGSLPEYVVGRLSILRVDFVEIESGR